MSLAPTSNENAERRAAARRTAWIVGAVAALVYLAFMLAATH